MKKTARLAFRLGALILVCCLISAGQVQEPSQLPAVEIRMIVVSSQMQAEELLQRLQEGEDFAALAHQNSIDPSASDGGSLGHIDPGTLRTELREALRGAIPGEIKGPI